MKQIILLITAGLMGLIALGCWHKPPAKEVALEKTTITISEVRERVAKANPVLLDVRTPQEYEGPLGHVEGSILIPLQELETRLSELDQFKTDEIIVICRSGNRSGKATAFLRNNGFKALNMLGGMLKWNATP